MSDGKNQRLDRLRAREADLRSKISDLDLYLSHLPTDSRMASEYKLEREVLMARLGPTLNEIEDLETAAPERHGGQDRRPLSLHRRGRDRLERAARHRRDT